MVIMGEKNIDTEMEQEYDFSSARPNPYVVKRRPVSMNLAEEEISYFKQQAQSTGIPYQNLINLYLVQCARERKTLNFT